MNLLSNMKIDGGKIGHISFKILQIFIIYLKYGVTAHLILNFGHLPINNKNNIIHISIKNISIKKLARELSFQNSC